MRLQCYAQKQRIVSLRVSAGANDGRPEAGGSAGKEGHTGNEVDLYKVHSGYACNVAWGRGIKAQLAVVPAPSQVVTRIECMYRVRVACQAKRVVAGVLFYTWPLSIKPRIS